MLSLESTTLLAVKTFTPAIMKCVYESVFYEVNFEEVSKLAEIKMKSSSVDMAKEDFKTNVLAIMEVCINLGVEVILFNNLEQRFTITPELQEWYVQAVMRKWGKKPIPRAAYLVPAAFIERLSVEQTADELADQVERNAQFFTEREEAIAWLCEK